MKRAWRASIAAWVLANVGLSSGVSRASEGPSVSPAGAVPAVPSEGSAEASYEKAVSAYTAGDVHGALDFMRDSYRLSQRPELLYNLASLERELRQCRSSLEHYQRYLELVPAGRYRDRAERASKELEHECPATVRSDRSANQGRVPLEQRGVDDHRSHPYWTPPRIVGLSAVVTGVLAGGAALYFFSAAKAARDDVQQSVTAQVNGGPPWDQRRQEDQHRDQALAQVFGVTAGALITGGALVLLLAPRNAPRDRPSFSIYVQPGAAQAGYSRHF